MGHFVELFSAVLVSMGELVCAAFLSKGDSIASEFTINVFEVDFDVEFLLSVDVVLVTRAVCSFGMTDQDIGAASASVVALIVESVRIGCIAGVTDCFISPAICLHDVELRAVIAANFVSITVVHPII